MIPGADELHVTPPRTDEQPVPKPYTVPAHVSWDEGTEQRLVIVDSLTTVITRYVKATYTPEHSIPARATVTWRGLQFETDGPEEIHTDMQGRLHHKTRRLRATEYR